MRNEAPYLALTNLTSMVYCCSWLAMLRTLLKDGTNLRKDISLIRLTRLSFLHLVSFDDLGRASR
jgi:hypothetical protein